jgi:hypothetical protein
LSLQLKSSLLTNRWSKREIGSGFVPNPIAPFELRRGKIRIFYDVQKSVSVTILAIGTKEGSKLYIEEKEVPA